MKLMSLNLRKCLNILIVVVIAEMVVILFGAVGLHMPHWVLVRSAPFGFHWFNDTDDEYRKGVDYGESSTSFLSRYKQYCERNFYPRTANVLRYRNSSILSESSGFCNCVPDTLTGSINTTTFLDDFVSLEKLHPELSPGGEWSPVGCLSRQRVAVIIPFRDREEHLRMLLQLLHPMLQNQMLDYSIFVVEQAEPEVFNKAMLMNSGFVEARRHGNYDCYVFHDVDMIPLDDRNFYVCSAVPRHLGAFISKWNYDEDQIHLSREMLRYAAKMRARDLIKYIDIPYEGIFGGVTAFSDDQFTLVNGFSNQYYGWGGEDDDMFRRIQAKKLKITRFPRSVARYDMIKHNADKRNPYNIKSSMGWRFRPLHYDRDGVNSVKYTVKSKELRPLFIWLSIALPPPPPNFKSLGRYSNASAPSFALFLIFFNILLCTFYY